MGTRADFYVKRTDHLLWLGSIAWDGYPDGIDESVIGAPRRRMRSVKGSPPSSRSGTM